MSNYSAMMVQPVATTSRVGMVVKAAPEHRVQQGSDYRAGVSAETTGSQVIWLV